MPSTTDLWDVSQGTVVVADSGIRPGSLAGGMFGEGAVLEESGNTIFADGQPEGFVHYIEWQTPAEVAIASFALFASGDGPDYQNEREFATFTLKARSSELSPDFDLVLCQFTPSHPYTWIDENSRLLLFQSIAPVTARSFRAEFVQYTARRGYDGPRIIELDAFPPATPPPPQCVAAPPGLVGWWRGEGNADDALGANNGTAANGLGYSAGEVGQAFNLDGVDDEVQVPASASLSVQSLTMEAWINPADVSTQRPVVEWCAENDSAGVHLWISVMPPMGGGSLAGTLFADLRDISGGDHVLYSAPGLVLANRWSHVA